MTIRRVVPLVPLVLLAACGGGAHRPPSPPGPPVEARRAAAEAPKFLHAMYGDELDVDEVLVGDGTIRAFAGRPQRVHARDGADAAMLLVLFLSLPDATLQTVDFWVTPGLAGEAGCIAFAE